MRGGEGEDRKKLGVWAGFQWVELGMVGRAFVRSWSVAVQAFRAASAIADTAVSRTCIKTAWILERYLTSAPASRRILKLLIQGYQTS